MVRSGFRSPMVTRCIALRSPATPARACPDRPASNRKSGRYSTHVPCLSAGSITVRTWSSRAAANNSVSASGPEQLAHPGQHQMPDDFGAGRSAGLAGDDGAQFRASSRSASVLIWVDLPDPSPPSKEMKSSAPARSFDRCFSHGQSFSAPARNSSDHEFAHAVDRRAASSSPWPTASAA